jgi:ribosomal protein S6
LWITSVRPRFPPGPPAPRQTLAAHPGIVTRLATLFRSVARVVYRESGQFRRVENMGVRPLATPVRIEA